MYKMNKYVTRYTNRKGERVKKIVSATHADNAYMYVKVKFGAKNIQVKKK